MVESERRRGRARTRILYWFRTPPGVKVGRSPLDESAMRSIEERHPDIEFDWTRILKEQPPPEAAARPPVPERRGPRRQSEPRPSKERRSTPPMEVPPSVAPEAVAPIALPEPPIAAEGPLPMPVAEGTPDPERSGPGDIGIDDRPGTPAHARLGPEGVHRLRIRHAEILARIVERVSDPVQQDELKGQVERLNPDRWVTEEEVRLGLEQYESVLEALRSVVGQGRRRRRRSVAPRDGAAEAAAAGPSESSPDPGPTSAGGRHAQDEEPV